MDVRWRVAGAVITKLPDDPSILEPGLEELESKTGVPVLGVISHNDPGLPAEDSISLTDCGESSVTGAEDGVPDGEAATVAVPRLLRISNATDLESLAREPRIRVAYRSPKASLTDVDAVVLPVTMASGPIAPDAHLYPEYPFQALKIDGFVPPYVHRFTYRRNGRPSDSVMSASSSASKPARSRRGVE